MKRLLCALLISVLPAVLACGSESPVEPISSGPLIMTFSDISPSDIENGVIDRDRSIATAAAGLWISYVRLVTDLCGNTPTGFTVHSVSATLNFEESVNVISLEQVLDGPVTVYLTAGGTSVDIGTGTLGGLGPVALTGFTTPDALVDLYEDMLAGTFSVGLRGETSRTAEDDFLLNIDIEFLTRASCE